MYGMAPAKSTNMFLETLSALLFGLFLSSVHSQNGCEFSADIMFILDASDSMTSKNFMDQKDFVRDLTQDFTFDSMNGFMVGAIAFSARVQEIPLYPFKTYNEFTTSLYALEHDQEGSYTHRALTEMRQHFQVFGRRNRPWIAVILTDGRSKIPLDTMREANIARSTGITVMSVGIGSDINIDELTNLASSQNLVFSVFNLVTIRRLSYNIASVICSSTTPGGRVTTPSPITPAPVTPVPITTPVPNPVTPSGPVTTGGGSRFTGGPDTPATTLAPGPGPVTTPTPIVTVPSDRSTVQPPTHNSDDPCYECIYTNGVGFVQHRRCDLYYHCTEKDGSRSHIVRKCGRGQFWDQSVLTCRPPSQVVCPNDPCRDTSLLTYENLDNCATFWKCYEGRTDDLVCCDLNLGYVSRFQGCGFSPFCQNTCSVTRPPTVVPRCYKTSDPLNPAKYYTHIFGIRYHQNCAAGTAFSQMNCSCTLFSAASPAKYECKPELYLPFDTDTLDKSGHGMWTSTEGDIPVRYVPGAVGDGAAFINEANRIILSRFANDDFRQQILIKFRYLELATIGRLDGMESLVSNSDCERDCSIDVSLDRRNGRTIAKVKTFESGAKSASLIHRFGVWKDVQYLYDGKQFTLSVNGVTTQIPVTGNIVPVQAALQIGHGCESSNPFVGYIDEFYLYKCLP